MEKSWSWIIIVIIWLSDDLELFNYNSTEMPYISTKWLFAHDAAGKAAFDSWSAGWAAYQKHAVTFGCPSATGEVF